MKTIQITLTLLLFLSLTVCKKNKDTVPDTQFDINNPQGYAIVIKHKNFSYAGISAAVLIFQAADKQMVNGYDMFGERTFRYHVNGNVLKIADPEIIYEFRIEKDKLIVLDSRAEKADLIKIPAENQLLGKTFTGKYYNANGTVHQASFFYAFWKEGNKVNVGYQLGTTMRTETYFPVANIGALVKGNGFTEFVLAMPDGAVACTYLDGNNPKFGVFN